MSACDIFQHKKKNGGIEVPFAGRRNHRNSGEDMGDNFKYFLPGVRRIFPS